MNSEFLILSSFVVSFVTLSVVSVVVAVKGM